MSSKRMEAKNVVVTGAASGIGAAVAERFAAEGASVTLADLKLEEAETLAQRIGAEAVHLDVCSSEDWQSALTVAQQNGPLTTLVNCAGISVPGSIEEVDLDQFRQIHAINLEGTFLGCKYAIEAMKTGSGGSIVNVASSLGVRPLGGFLAYSSSKGAVRMLTKSVALHCAEQGYDIRANGVNPGAILTPMMEPYFQAMEAAGLSRDQAISTFAEVYPMKRVGQAYEVANAVLYLASDESTFTTGTDISVAGGGLV